MTAGPSSLHKGKLDVDKTSPRSLLVLHGLNKDQTGAVYSVQRPMVFGRSRACDVYIADATASRQQARFFRTPKGALMIEDLGSSNGSLLNGEPVTTHVLVEGDVIRLGDTDFEVRRVPYRQTVELLASSNHEETRVVKPASTVEFPSLQAVRDTDYLQSISVDPDAAQPSPPSEAIASLHGKTLHLATLLEISTLIQRFTTPAPMLEAVLDLLLEIPGGDFGFVAMRGSGEDLTHKASRSRHGGTNEQVVLSQTVSRYVLEEQCAVLATDVRNDTRFSASQSILHGPRDAILAAPIIIGSQPLGLIALCHDQQGSCPTEDDLDLLCVAASLIGPALRTMELTRLREENLRELEQANATILAAQSRLVQSEKMAALGRLSSGVIHEVRNHLSPLLLAEMVAEIYPDDADVQEMTELVIEARERIVELVDEVRIFARGETRSYSMERYSLSDLVEQVIRFLRCDANVRRAKLSHTRRAPVAVTMDAPRIRQVLINLIQNAAQATTQNAAIDVRVYRDGQFACVDVEDNGTGIPTDLREKIFEPLFTTKGDQGLGLGLDICRQIVEAHHGSLSCISEVNTGTTFTLRIPLEPPEPA